MKDRAKEEWISYKKRKLESLEKAKKRGEVDEWIISILDRINFDPNYVTLSSCAGRIAVMDMPDFGNKRDAIFLGKWHYVPPVEEIKRAIEAGKMTTWVMLNPPILHIACFDLESAERLILSAQKAGIRRAGIISLRHNVVEVCGHERMEIPVRFGKRLPFDVESFLRLAEMKLERSRRKFERFCQLVSDSCGT